VISSLIDGSGMVETVTSSLTLALGETGILTLPFGDGMGPMKSHEPPSKLGLLAPHCTNFLVPLGPVS